MPVLTNMMLWALFLIATIACILSHNHYPAYILSWGVLLCVSIILLIKTHLKRKTQRVSTYLRTVKCESVVFILGPWAKTWFSHVKNNDAMKIAQGTVWFLASNTAELTRHIEKLETGYPDVIPSVFFPLMPDGNQTPEIMHTELTRWIESFSDLALNTSLPCTFALYAQMTTYRPAHENALAVWNGEYHCVDSGEVTFTSGVARLSENLEGLATQSVHHLRRYALFESMSSWLQESGLLSTLEQLFSTLPLRLNGLMLCDYGSGFVRHGAWSRWSEEEFGVLPGLSTSLTTPPLPEQRPVYADKEITQALPFAQTSITGKAVLILTLMISAVMLTKFGLAVWHARDLRDQMAIYATPELRTTEERAAATARINEEYQKVMTCNGMTNLLAFGFSHCDTLKNELSLLTHPESVQISKTPMWSISGFASSSATLTQEQEKKLLQLLPLISRNDVSRYVLAGYSDNTGSEQQNNLLSEQRAITVRNWLVAHTTIPVTRFIIRGAGNSNPVTSNELKSERAKNRRVEITPFSQSNVNTKS